MSTSKVIVEVVGLLRVLDELNAPIEAACEADEAGGYFGEWSFEDREWRKKLLDLLLRREALEAVLERLKTQGQLPKSLRAELKNLDQRGWAFCIGIPCHVTFGHRKLRQAWERSSGSGDHQYWWGLPYSPVPTGDPFYRPTYKKFYKEEESNF